MLSGYGIDIGCAVRHRWSRLYTYNAGPFSRIAATLAGRVACALTGGSTEQKQDAAVTSPRSRTAVAAAARHAAAKRVELARLEAGSLAAVGTTARDPEDAANAMASSRLAPLLGNSQWRAAAARGPVAFYRHLVEHGALMPDAAQEKALADFDELFQVLGHDTAGARKAAPRGVYLHGHVGTGKTLLLDMLHVSLSEGRPSLRSRRTHLHDLLCQAHSELHLIRMCEGANNNNNDSNSCAKPHRHDSGLGSQTARPGLKTDEDVSPFFAIASGSHWWLLGEDGDRGRRRTGRAAGIVHAMRQGQAMTSVEQLAHSLAQKLDILLFDEVAISTIQDCVVLGPLLRVLCDCGVTIVATSNRAPGDLYAGGLNRHVHLPQVISSITQHCTVHLLAATADHRVRMASEEAIQFSSSNRRPSFAWQCRPGHSQEAFVDAWWTRRSHSQRAKALRRDVDIGYGRTLSVLQSPCGNCVCFRFEELCSTELGAQDFAAICSTFRMLVVSDVPRLRGDMASEAQRWIWLLDQCYEQHTQLVMTTEADGPEDLLDLSGVASVGAGSGQSLAEVSFAVARATSRLYEMQTKSFREACEARQRTK